jgi:hypothetical protein
MRRIKILKITSAGASSWWFGIEAASTAKIIITAMFKIGNTDVPKDWFARTNRNCCTNNPKTGNDYNIAIILVNLTSCAAA